MTDFPWTEYWQDVLSCLFTFVIPLTIMMIFQYMRMASYLGIETEDHNQSAREAFILIGVFMGVFMITFFLYHLVVRRLFPSCENKCHDVPVHSRVEGQKS